MTRQKKAIALSMLYKLRLKNGRKAIKIFQMIRLFKMPLMVNSRRIS